MIVTLQNFTTRKQMISNYIKTFSFVILKFFCTSSRHRTVENKNTYNYETTLPIIVEQEIDLQQRDTHNVTIASLILFFFILYPRARACAG